MRKLVNKFNKLLAASEARGGILRLTFQMTSASLKHGAMLSSIELLGTKVPPVVRAPTAGPTDNIRIQEVNVG